MKILHEKSCSKCKQILSVDRFTKDSSKKYGLTSWCKDCTAAYWKKVKADPEHRRRRIERGKQWRLANPERNARGIRSATLKKKYGLTVDQYDALLLQQGGGCAICGNTESLGNGALHVDHDHATGLIRGILCQPCNTGLGKFRDSEALLLRAVAYLKGE